MGAGGRRRLQQARSCAGNYRIKDELSSGPIAAFFEPLVNRGWCCKRTGGYWRKLILYQTVRDFVQREHNLDDQLTWHLGIAKVETDVE